MSPAEDRASRARFLKRVCEAHEANAREIGDGWREPAARERLRRGSRLITRVIAGGVRAGNEDRARRAARPGRAR